MQFRILGSPELYDEKRQRRAPLTSPKQVLLLGALLAEPNTPVPRSRLVRELWGAVPPQKASNTLNAHVSGLRKVLLAMEPERNHSSRLLARDSAYLLEARTTETDIGRFRSAVTEAKTLADDDPQGAYDALRRALALWRGSPLEGASHGPACAALVERLEEEKQKALEILFDCALRTGQHRYIVPELEEVITAYPLRERFHDQLMLALCRCGRGGEAIGVYTRARQRLSAVTGHTPLLSARLEQISVQSPDLFAPGTQAPEDWTRGAGRMPAGREFDRLRDEVNEIEYEVNRIEAEQETARSVVGYLTDLLSGQALYGSV